MGERPVWPPAPLAALCWVYVMIAGSLISYSAYLLLLERTTPALATSYTYVNPVVALVLGVTLGQELVSPFEWLAVAVVLCGVVLLMPSRPEHGSAHGERPSLATPRDPEIGTTRPPA
jgi:drug/metabolite transporter (DMT)-like permease